MKRTRARTERLRPNSDHLVALPSPYESKPDLTFWLIFRTGSTPSSRAFLAQEPYQKLGPPPASLLVTHTVARVSDKAPSFNLLLENNRTTARNLVQIILAPIAKPQAVLVKARDLVNPGLIAEKFKKAPRWIKWVWPGVAS
jgi:hypothetical protein